MTDALPRIATSHIKKHHPNPALRRRESLFALLLISPWLLGFILLKLYPIVTALWYSFSNFNMLKPTEAQFIGLANYGHVFVDLKAWTNMAGSLGYFILTVPIELLVALALAAIFSSGRLRAKGIFRPLFFMPSIIPAGAIYMIWIGFVDPYTGWLNKLVMEPLGLPPVAMSFGQFPPLFLTIMALWSIGPGFLIMHGAMQGVPKELHEAARVDGAGPLMRFISITLPIISPAIFFSLVIDLTSAFGGSVLLDRGFVFSQATNMEGYIYSVMFRQLDLGYASALAWVMFTVTMTITIILFRSARRWVYFPEESGYESI
jgi:multiple sugar transport system permease protein